MTKLRRTTVWFAHHVVWVLKLRTRKFKRAGIAQRGTNEEPNCTNHTGKPTIIKASIANRTAMAANATWTSTSLQKGTRGCDPQVRNYRGPVAALPPEKFALFVELKLNNEPEHRLSTQAARCTNARG